MNREDFLLLKQNIIYLDNGATSLKPKIISQTISDYYNNYSANAHRGDYDLSLKVDSKYEETRKLVKDFINAKKTKEIVFTSGATDSLNKIIFGFFICKKTIAIIALNILVIIFFPNKICPIIPEMKAIGIIVIYILSVRLK